MDASGGSERPEAQQAGGAIWGHMQARYLFACELAARRRVLEIACGNGFGTMLLAQVASSVTGADVSPEAIETARRTNARPNVRYELVKTPPFPLPDASFDVVVSLETIEHMPAAAQPAFVAELERVLAPDGVLLLSTPDRATEQAQAKQSEPNPFHIHTPSAEELDRLLARFAHREAFVLMDYVATTVVPLEPGARTAKLEAPNVALETPPPPPASAFPVAVFRACARTAEGLARIRAARAPVVYRTDYQRLAYLAQAVTASRLHDLAHLPPAEQLAVVVERVARLVDAAEGRVQKLEDQTRDLWVNVDRLNKNLSVKGVVDRILGRNS